MSWNLFVIVYKTIDLLFYLMQFGDFFLNLSPYFLLLLDHFWGRRHNFFAFGLYHNLVKYLEKYLCWRARLEERASLCWVAADIFFHTEKALTISDFFIKLIMCCVAVLILFLLRVNSFQEWKLLITEVKSELFNKSRDTPFWSKLKFFNSAADW